MSVVLDVEVVEMLGNACSLLLAGLAGGTSLQTLNTSWFSIAVLFYDSQQLLLHKLESTHRGEPGHFYLPRSTGSKGSTSKHMQEYRHGCSTITVKLEIACCL